MRYNDVAPEVYRGFGFPGADDPGQHVPGEARFRGAYCAARDIDLSRSLNPELLSFDAWLERNRDRIRVGSEAATV